MLRIDSRLQALEQRTTRKRAGIRIFTQDTENPAHYYEGIGLGCIYPGGAMNIPHSLEEIERYRSQRWTCIVICYESEALPVWG
jgi:hypothetical protein